MSQRGFSPLFILLGGLSLLIAGFFIYYLAKPSTTSVPTVNWKTYTNSQAYYSFKYPPTWPLVVEYHSPQCIVCIESIVFTPAYNPNSEDTNIAVVEVFKEDNIRTLDDYVNIHYKGDKSKINLQYTTVGGQKAISYKLSGGFPPLPIIEYVVVQNSFQYIIRLEDSAETNKNKAENVKAFNQVLTTFKFTDLTQPVDMTDWKTYQNTTYGFSLKYPADMKIFNIDELGSESRPPKSEEDAETAKKLIEFTNQTVYLGIHIEPNPKHLSLRQYSPILNGRSSLPSNIQEKDLTINDRSALVDVISSHDPHDMVEYFVDFDSYILQLTFEGQGDYSDSLPLTLVDQIISSLKSN